jgi:hypothetical protein
MNFGRESGHAPIKMVIPFTQEPAATEAGPGPTRQACCPVTGCQFHGEPAPALIVPYGVPGRVGQRIGSIDKASAAACRRAGISDLHFHDLRREAGSRWLEGGVSLQVVRDWLGHTNVSQTSTYLATTPAGEYDAMRRFEAFQKQIAFPCITGVETAPQRGTIGVDVGKENTENIEENRSGEGFMETENRSVDSSILSLATIY